MPPSRRIPGLVTALFAAVALTACASTASYPGSLSRTILVVNNAHTALNSMDVHLITPAGARVPLGTIGLNESRSFEIRRDLKPGGYRLEARGFRRLLSREFVLAEGDVVEWDLSRNAVLFQGKAEGGSGGF